MGLIIGIDPPPPADLNPGMDPNSKTLAQDHAFCRNCGIPLQGQFCHDCGQKHLSHRLSTKMLFSQFTELLTEFDGRLWKTLRSLAANPGKVALQYIEGGRAQFLNPIRFLFVTFTVYLALMVITGAQVDIASRIVLPTTEETLNTNTQVLLNYLVRVVASQMDVVIFFTIPLLAFLIRWQYFRAHRNYAETFTFVCFVFGLGYLFAAVLVPVQFLLDMNSAYPKNIITGCLFIYGAKTFFEMSWVISLLAGAVTALAYFVTMPVVSTGIAIIEIYIDQWL